MRPIMTQEDKDKELLFKDLCARLPYGVKIEVVEDDYFSSVEDLDCYYLDRVNNKFYKIKPYLFPLSSMTERQKKEYYLICSALKLDIAENESAASLVDWYHKNHFDWRGLIPKDLAIDATGLNIY
jgi:hypothetical protein